MVTRGAASEMKGQSQDFLDPSNLLIQLADYRIPRSRWYRVAV